MSSINWAWARNLGKGQRFGTQSEKKKEEEEEEKTQPHREHPNHRDSGDRHPQTGGKKEGTVQVN